MSRFSKSESVPFSALQPFVKDYLNRYETNGWQGGFGRLEDDISLSTRSEAILEERSAVSILAEEAGISPSTLTKYLSGRSKTLSFDVADRLISAMGRPDYWNTPDLIDIYDGVCLGSG